MAGGLVRASKFLLFIKKIKIKKIKKDGQTGKQSKNGGKLNSRSGQKAEVVTRKQKNPAGHSQAALIPKRHAEDHWKVLHD